MEFGFQLGKQDLSQSQSQLSTVKPLYKVIQGNEKKLLYREVILRGGLSYREVFASEGIITLFYREDSHYRSFLTLKLQSSPLISNSRDG